jgi:hypothetical protein
MTLTGHAGVVSLAQNVEKWVFQVCPIAAAAIGMVSPLANRKWSQRPKSGAG